MISFPICLIAMRRCGFASLNQAIDIDLIYRSIPEYRNPTVRSPYARQEHDHSVRRGGGHGGSGAPADLALDLRKQTISPFVTRSAQSSTVCGPVRDSIPVDWSCPATAVRSWRRSEDEISIVVRYRKFAISRGDSLREIHDLTFATDTA